MNDELQKLSDEQQRIQKYFRWTIGAMIALGVLWLVLNIIKLSL